MLCSSSSDLSDELSKVDDTITVTATFLNSSPVAGRSNPVKRSWKPDRGCKRFSAFPRDVGLGALAFNQRLNQLDLDSRTNTCASHT
jgi:hypothetical protein